MELVSRSHGLHVRAVSKERRTAEFIASTDALDSYDERVEQVWQLDRFKKNPVVLFAHNNRALPIGKAIHCAVEDGKLVCTIQFATEKANPDAELVWQSVTEETLRAVSVGFYPHTIRIEKENDREVVVLSDNELFEISVVPIPANPEALARMRARAHRVEVPAQREENDMNLEETTKKLADAEATIRQREADARVTEKALVDERARNAALETQNKTLATERDAAVKELGEVRAKALEAEVGALVGVKITAAEKDTFVRLANADRRLFDEMVAQRAPLRLNEQVIPAPKNPPAAPDANDVADIEKELAAE